mgnify:CR=1 FL=1
MLDPLRILTDQRRRERLDVARHRLFTPGDPGFTDALNPVVGFDNDKQERTDLANNMRTNGCNLHGNVLTCGAGSG